MKSILLTLSAGTMLMLASCGHITVKDNSSKTDSTKTSTQDPAVTTSSSKVPPLAINEADWELKDLSTVASYIHVSMKVPKSAKLESQNDVGVAIKLSPYYTINVTERAESSIKDAMEFDKAPVKDTTNSNRKVLKEEANGMIYTFQMPPESNGTKYEPEVHFAYYVGQPGNLFAISDDIFATADTTGTVNGSYYSEDVANKIFAIIKASAKVNQ